MQLQLNDYIALELVPCSPVRDTGFKRTETGWNWAKVVGVGVPVKKRGSKTCFVAKLSTAKGELLGVLAETTGSSYRGLDTPFALYFAYMTSKDSEKVSGRLIAYRDLQLDPVNGDCGYLVFDTLEMSDREKHSGCHLEEFGVWYYKTQGEVESFIRKLYGRKMGQLSFLAHQARLDTIEVETELKKAGFALISEFDEDLENLRRDGEAIYRVTSGVLNTTVVSMLPGLADRKHHCRSLVKEVLCDLADENQPQG